MAQFINPELILTNLRCPIKAYDPKGADEKFVPLAYVPLSYKGWTEYKYVLVHESQPEFLLGNDIAFLAHQESLKNASIQAITRSQSKLAQDCESDFSSEDSLDEKLMETASSCGQN